MRILTVDDNPIIRMGLRALLEGADGVTSVTETADPDEAAAQVEAGAVDVVLLDVRMPRVSGLALLPRLSGGATVIMLTHDDDPTTLSEAIAAGAAGYLVHGALDPRAIVHAIQLCWDGSQVISGVSPAPAGTVTSEPPQAERGPLSPRESEVMDLVAEGLSNREVAARLFLSEKTVRNHLNRLFIKLGVTTRSQAIVRWIHRAPRSSGATDPAGTGRPLGHGTLGARSAGP